MKELLKSLNLSDNATKIYIEGFGKFPFAFSEIHNLMPNLSENEVKHVLDELIEKKLIAMIKPRYPELMTHYLAIPPYTAIINSLTELSKIPEVEKPEDQKRSSQFDKFQDNLYQDIENIIQDLIDIISTQDSTGQTTEILTEVEQNVKKFAQVILSDAIELVTPLKFKAAVDASDVNKVIKSIEQKIEESKELVSNMFSQFRDIVKEMSTSPIAQQVDGFKSFIRKLGESIDNRIQEISLEPITLSSEKIRSMADSLSNILTDYISKNKDSLKNLWPVTSREKIKEVISLLLKKCSKKLTIIVPNIEDFIPLEKFELDYSQVLNSETQLQGIIPSKVRSKKPKSTGPTITKKQKKEVEEKLDLTARKVAELKGFELSHDVADMLAIISEIQPESVVIENIQQWLNRLLVIRKHLDSNTQYLLLEAIEKWKKDFLKSKPKEEEPVPTEDIEEKASKEMEAVEKPSINGLQIVIISSETHQNKHVLAFNKKGSIDYLSIDDNNIIAILGDDSYLLLGITQKIENEPLYEVIGFYTNFNQLIDLLNPLILKISKEGKPPKEIQINRGFNEIIENINDFTGRKIGKRLKNLLDVVFEKDGISLNILELKLLIGKLEKMYHPLENEMKQYVIDELNKLNKEFSTLELIFPPEFRRPISEEKTAEIMEHELLPEEIDVSPIDSEKINELFNIFLEKVDDLKGNEIGEQIDKFIDVVLKLQGYSRIIDWKKELQNIDEILKEPIKEKLKNDLLKWKAGILKPSPVSEVSITEEHAEIYAPQQDKTFKIEEEYISPGLMQSQFPSEDVIPSETPTEEDSSKDDPKIKMKEEFDDISNKLDELKGIEISKKLQNIIDIILETEGYSMAFKGIKDWMSKLRMIRNPLEDEIKKDFEVEFLKWKEKFV